MITSNQGGLRGLSDKAFVERLKSATNEDKQINPIYVDAISANLSKLKAGLDKSSASYAMYTDGVFDCYYISDNGNKEWFIMQLECKQDVDLNDSEQLANVLIQVCFYLKRFYEGGYQIPKVVVLGTKINCMAIPTIYLWKNYIEPFGKYSYPTEELGTGKKISASTAPFNPIFGAIKNRIINDVNLTTSTRIIEVTDKNSVKELCIDIIKVAKDLGLKEEITEATVSRAFDYFDMKVLSKKSREGLTSRQKAEVFMTLFLTPEKAKQSYDEDVLGNKIYSDKMNIGGVIVEVEPGKFNSFANVFAVKKYDISDQKKITAITDRLIEDTDRRRKGDFYTPTIWVDEAHKLMDKNLGVDWREKYIVWDCAWGTGNLTRDYKFSNLYCSTLQSEDLTIGAKYNPFATKFQYDFLNDDVDLMEQAVNTLWEPFIGTRFSYNKQLEKYINFGQILDLYAQAVDKGITTEEKCKIAYTKAVDMLKHTVLYEKAPSLVGYLLETDENKKKGLVFLINPPYGTSTDLKSVGGKSGANKAGIADSKIDTFMEIDGLSGSSRQLVAQFIYRINKLCQMFDKPLCIGLFSPSSIFSSDMYKPLMQQECIGCSDAFILQASNFADVSDNWGISFSLLDRSGKKGLLTILDISDGRIVKIGNKQLNYVEKESKASKWVREPIAKDKKSKNHTYITSALKIGDNSKSNAFSDNAIGSMMNNANNVGENTQAVALASGIFTHKAIAVTKDNFGRCTSLFAARKVIQANWINWQDEYMVPNVNHPDYAQWQNDCVVYSLFNNKSNQSSLRNIDYNGKSWDIFNEFFWISRQDIYDWAIQVNNQAVIDDVLANAKSERFVYEKLKTINLSDDAKQILDYATALVKDTMQYREEFDRKHPEYHINTWDAGWYQIKAVIKEYKSDELKVFNDLYKQFEDRMRPLVYELGFLYK